MNANEIKWKKIETEELSIMIPRNFIGGNPKKDKKRIAEEINKLDEKYRLTLKKFFSLPQFIFSAVDTNIDESTTYLSNLLMLNEKIPLLSRSMPMEKYIKESKKRLPKKMVITEEGASQTRNYPAARILLYEQESKGLFKKSDKIVRNLLFYSIKTRTKFWDFTFASGHEKFDEMLPIFEQIMDSVELKIE
jgi:hypothetical protein